MQSNYQNIINKALGELAETRSISSALLVCNTLLEYMGVETKNIEDIELSKFKLPNAERYDRWFEAHPHFRGDRACFDLLPREEKKLEAKFFALQKKSKLFIAGAVNFTPNFEDRDYTRNDPNMKVGIDFFLTPEKNSVIVVLSNKGNLRLVELSGRLTNTQNEIFILWEDIAKKSEDKNIFHLTIWDSFKLSSLNKKFYEGMVNSFTTLTQHLQTAGVENQLANQFANRMLGRLLFLWFLRKKHIINEEKEYFLIDCDDNAYYQNKLSVLFFNVLNNESHKDFDSVTPYLNGGLFDQKADGTYWNNHKPTFPVGFFKALYAHFDAFNFTTDESTPEYEQIAIDPEMLGRIFESFLATLTTETGAQAKKANGAFYTPREIVAYMSRESLRQYLHTKLEAGEILKKSIDDLLDLPDHEWAIAGTNSKRDAVAKEDRERIITALREVKVLDPAVGSGAFPMGVLHKMLSVLERLESNFDSYEAKLAILKNNIYGVDIDPTAIEISRLRAWLSIIVDVKDVKKIKPLPNLEFKFVCANTLILLDDSEQATFLTDHDLKDKLIEIRDDYFKTSSKSEKERLQKKYLKLTQNATLFDNRKTQQLKSYQPFENGKCASFYDPEMMHGVNFFDIVIGNPPYVQIQKFSKQKIQKDLENQGYKTFSKTGDLYVLFYENGIRLSKKETGLLCYITSNKWMRAGYGEKVREYFAEHNPLILLDLGSGVFDSATVDSNIMLIENSNNKGKTTALTIKNNKQDLQTQIKEESVVLNFSSKNGWFIGNSLEINLKKKIESIGMPLKKWDIKINRGILTGLNEAFIIDQKKRDELIGRDPRNAEIIKPILRGRDINRYGYTSAGMYLIMTGFDIDIPRLYPIIFDYLKSFELKARKRDDQGKNWWNLRACVYYNDFEKEKVVWGNISYDSCFSYVEDGVYVNAPANMITSEKISIKYLIACMNASIFNWEFKQSGIFLGKAYEWKKQYIENIHIPKLIPENEKEIRQIENLVDKIITLKKQDNDANTKELESQIDQLVYQLYGLTKDEIKIVEDSNKK